VIFTERGVLKRRTSMRKTVIALVQEEINNFRAELNGTKRGYRDTHLNNRLDALEHRLLIRLRKLHPEPELCEKLDETVLCNVTGCGYPATYEGWMLNRTPLGIPTGTMRRAKVCGDPNHLPLLIGYKRDDLPKKENDRAAWDTAHAREAAERNGR
jgi:hypothetical protein